MTEDDYWFEGPDDEDDELVYEDEFDDDSSMTVPCPECGAEIYEDAVQCPICGTYVSPGLKNVWLGRPVWWIIIGLLGIVATTLALAGLVPW